MRLNIKQERFAIAYSDNGGHGTKAAISAGYSEASAHERSCDLLKNPKVLNAIEEREADKAAAVNLTRERVIRLFVDLAFADASKISSVKVSACLNCWPSGTRALLVDAGLRVDPNPKCQLCNGIGVSNSVMADTRDLSPAERRLIAGVKQTKDGIEVKLIDQTPYRLAVAKMVGLVSDQANVNVAVGVSADPGKMTEVEFKDLPPEKKKEALARAMAKLGVQVGVSEKPEPLTIEGSTS